jgi:hypothetical protein
MFYFDALVLVTKEDLSESVYLIEELDVVFLISTKACLFYYPFIFLLKFWNLFVNRDN